MPSLRRRVDSREALIPRSMTSHEARDIVPLRFSRRSLPGPTVAVVERTSASSATLWGVLCSPRHSLVGLWAVHAPLHLIVLQPSGATCPGSANCVA
jgi:hypothetical protein